MTTESKGTGATFPEPEKKVPGFFIPDSISSTPKEPEKKETTAETKEFSFQAPSVSAFTTESNEKKETFSLPTFQTQPKGLDTEKKETFSFANQPEPKGPSFPPTTESTTQDKKETSSGFALKSQNELKEASFSLPDGGSFLPKAPENKEISQTTFPSFQIDPKVTGVSFLPKAPENKEISHTPFPSFLPETKVTEPEKKETTTAQLFPFGQFLPENKSSTAVDPKGTTEPKSTAFLFSTPTETKETDTKFGFASFVPLPTKDLQSEPKKDSTIIPPTPTSTEVPSFNFDPKKFSSNTSNAPEEKKLFSFGNNTAPQTVEAPTFSFGNLSAGKLDFTPKPFDFSLPAVPPPTSALPSGLFQFGHTAEMGEMETEKESPAASSSQFAFSTPFGTTPAPNSFGSLAPSSFGTTPAPTSFGTTPTPNFGTTPAPNFGATPAPNSFGSLSTPNSFGSLAPNSFGTTPAPNSFGSLSTPNTFGSIPSPNPIGLPTGFQQQSSGSFSVPAANPFFASQTPTKSAKKYRAKRK
eukprot:TRINITY_DN792_c0_g1_i1.p2 TRINITY_DN792_c0_g1~~TRINITY_DN792_c0_g1_i1.p2  ORF type:complete len:526 (+),score=153.55 TRINITY_DN792_c0_g1_i1:2589-4166(+)